MNSEEEFPEDNDGDETGLGLTIAELREALRKGASNLPNAMEVMGYVVTAEQGWIVKKYKDGTVERMEKIGSSKNGDTESRPNN
ncbi:hypothetical protein L0663_25900 [Dyadobacter sp. CY107]|uniref:hypothetical protein n=1 Tax=Dyadobacter fanqingshengii TaxID=2906443 RepID=UPI001F40381E|nr:hypothetical protein [Dyadobacter fanqingshengii]MCF2506850.1 hypothetical protein [Dyadobacter fanqingshengii]